MQKKVTKSYEISRHLIMEAYSRVKSSNGGSGIDTISLSAFDEHLKDNLYKLWNRMSSGSYFPSAVKVVEIPKSNGGTRSLGIPTVSDRIAQMVAVMVLEPLLEPVFHSDSFGYRPHRSAHDALSKARDRCWWHNWVVDMDISKFFDSIDHELLFRSLRRHTDCKWVLLYIRRWLDVPYCRQNGEVEYRTKGIPQGSVIGPLLANLYLHYAFDMWMQKSFPHIPFERYADDCVCHCKSQHEAIRLKHGISKRLAECKLALNEEKTRIVFCKNSRRWDTYRPVSFDFLGYTFKPRESVDKSGVHFTGYLPAISRKAKVHIMDTVRSWKLKSHTQHNLNSIAEMINPFLRGWIEYYGKFYPSVLKSFLRRRINRVLAGWIRRKYKRFRDNYKKACKWLETISKRDSALFYHWQWGALP